MVKRPKGGLLAGQWEFPSSCMWSSVSSSGTSAVHEYTYCSRMVILCFILGIGEGAPDERVSGSSH